MAAARLVSTFTGGRKLVHDIGNHPGAEGCLDKTARNTFTDGCGLSPQHPKNALAFVFSFSFLLDIFLFKFLPFIHFDDESLHAYYRDSGICWKVREREKMKNDLNSTSQRQPALLWYITPEEYM